MDKDFKVPYAHYTNKKYQSRPVVEWQSDDDNGKYYDAVYSDRIEMEAMSCGKSKQIKESAAKLFPSGTIGYWEQYLKLFFEDDTITLKKVMQGVNSSSGYSYLIFFYSK